MTFASWYQYRHLDNQYKHFDNQEAEHPDIEEELIEYVELERHYIAWARQHLK